MLRRFTLAALGALALAGVTVGLSARLGAQSLVPLLNGGGAPWWVLRAGQSAGADLWFERGLYYQVGMSNGAGVGNYLATSRASVAYEDDTSGNWIAFAANVPRVTNKGLLVEEARTNLFLNSQAPATQTVTVVNTSVYTVSVYGTATLTLSGAATGTVTQGNPVTFTAGSTSLVVTVSGAGGAFQNAQVELGAFATSPIPTTAGAVTRAADVVTMVRAPAFGGGYSLYGAASFNAPTSYGINQFIAQVDDGTPNNRALLTRQFTTAFAQATTETGGVQTTPINSVVWAQNAAGKIALSVAAGAQAASFNAGTVGIQSAALPVGVNAVRIGSNSGGATQTNGYITRLAIWPTQALSAAQLQALTR